VNMKFALHYQGHCWKHGIERLIFFYVVCAEHCDLTSHASNVRPSFIWRSTIQGISSVSKYVRSSIPKLLTNLLEKSYHLT
jgi:hypothetical protein